jgi:hypothetical protein
MKLGLPPRAAGISVPAVVSLLAALLAADSGCVEVKGGAVEIFWAVYSRSGAAITDCSCADPPIATVRLVLVGQAGRIEGNTPCAGQAQCDFPCQRDTGSTAFDIPPTEGDESYQISVVAVDSTGTEIPGDLVMTPAPILRSVVAGQATETEAFQLVAGCRAECGMNGSGVCARP